MKKQPLFNIKKDLWVLILDIIAVNISYFMAIVLRYYLRYHFVPQAAEYIEVFWKFAPIYTVVCIVVFLLFRLYNGLWEYAGVSHLNRIVLASVIASVLYVIGTKLLFRILPLSFYIVGAAIQLLLLMLIRFGYRIIAIEKEKAAWKKQPGQRMMIIGSGDTAQKTIKHLNVESFAKPIVVVDEKSKNKSIFGLPIVKDAAEAMVQYSVDCILIADPLISDAKREAIIKLCNEKEKELYDYTGFIKNSGGQLPLTDLLRVVSSPATIVTQRKSFDSGEAAIQALKGRYSVSSISGDKLTIEVKPSVNAGPSEDWIKEYEQESGEEVSFF